MLFVWLLSHLLTDLMVVLSFVVIIVGVLYVMMVGTRMMLE